MDKNAIFNYVEYAREELKNLVIQKAFEYGISSNGAQGGLSVVNNKVLSQAEKIQRNRLIEIIQEAREGKDFKFGFDTVIEEVSYTWFNRFIALRFMEVNGYLPSHTRVFSDENGEFNPQILTEALTLDIQGIDRNKVQELVQDSKKEELFKYLVILQCNELSKPIPVMFERIENYTELLFPNNLLKKDSIIQKLVEDIPEDDWKDQVQIIGWMYQFYVASKRESYRNEKVVTKKHIPTLSQVFTPDWIVRYMAENSVGRIWMESYPESTLKNDMSYYVDDAEQEDDVKQKIDAIKYQNVNLEDIKVIEPCCGSGHILVYVFDLLYKMYEEKGYSKKDIPSLILQKNIRGIDIDKRASQLAYFSLMMKARSADSRYFQREPLVRPRVYEILDSKDIIDSDYDYIDLMKKYNFSIESISTAKYIVETFENAKTIGSLLKVAPRNFKNLIDEIKVKKSETIANILEMDFFERGLPKLSQLAVLAGVMSRKYDVMITNPPYLGSAKLESNAKSYLINNYQNSKTDMFAMFMETPYVKNNGFRAIVNPDSWMFLVSFEKLRKDIIDNQYIVNMLHLGLGEFDATVQTTAFVLRNSKVSTNGVYFRLVDSKNKEKDFLESLEK